MRAYPLVTKGSNTMSLTLQTRYAIALTSLGFIEQKPTIRYRVFRGHHASLNGATPIERNYYLGKSGALRWSGEHKVTTSIPCLPRTSERLLSLPAVPNKETRDFLIRE